MTEEKLRRGINWWGSLLKTEYIKRNPTPYLWSEKDEQFLSQIKALIEGKVSDEFMEKWVEEFLEVLPNGVSFYIRRLLEDYHKELMK